MKPLAEEVDELVARVGTHPVWGYAHCLRVHALAEELARSEGIHHDREILRIAALLHDVGLYKAYAFREAPDHARRSADVAERILKDGDFPPQATRAVIEAIVHHPPGATPAASTEAALRHAESLRRKIPGLLVFDASRAIARERIIETEDFLKDLRNATQNLKLL